MIHTRLLLSFLLLLTGLAAQESLDRAAAGQSLVYKLNSEEFDRVTTLGMNHTWLMMFYAPWCPHCTHFLPVYHELAYNHTQNGLNATIRLGLVNCEKESYLCERWGIDGYP